jgi:hypothetical protein
MGVEPGQRALDDITLVLGLGAHVIPGHLPDGTAVPIRVDIEVTFELR